MSYLTFDPLCQGCQYKYITPLTMRDCAKCRKELGIDKNRWKHIWDAPDGSYKGECTNCGFVHFFIEGHDTQYKYCPSCGEKKVNDGEID